VVGIDPSLTSTGVAQLHQGQPVALNCFGKKLQVRASYAARAERMTFTLSQVLRAVPRDAELIVIEGMAYAANENHTDPDVFGLWWHVVTHLHARAVPIAVIPPLTLKVWATGKAAEKINGRMQRVDKADMIAAAQDQFPDVTIRNGDVADALHAAACGASWLGHPLPTQLRRHRYNVEAVAWPTLPAREAHA
jgi:Holliday junction resolvasome RuvABC endonuclease subunit